MKVVVERLLIFCFSFTGKTIWNQLHLNEFGSLREIRIFRGQICSCARIKGSIWHSTRKSILEQKLFCIRNFIKYYFNFTRNLWIFHYVNNVKTDSLKRVVTIVHFTPFLVIFWPTPLISFTNWGSINSKWLIEPQFCERY